MPAPTQNSTALSFEDGSGRRIEPETIRRVKLNLLGKRSVDSGAAFDIEEPV